MVYVSDFLKCFNPQHCFRRKDSSSKPYSVSISASAFSLVLTLSEGLSFFDIVFIYLSFLLYFAVFLSLLCTRRRFLFFFFYVSKYTYDVLLNPNPLSSAYRVMNRMNLSHSWEERMMYLASMHFGFPFTNFAFTSTCLKLFIIRKSELNRVCLLVKSGGSERETERETMETSRTR